MNLKTNLEENEIVITTKFVRKSRNWLKIEMIVEG